MTWNFSLILCLSLIEFSVSHALEIQSIDWKPNEQHRRPQIRFNPDGKLKIAIFSDLHYGEEPSTNWGPLQDVKSTGVMRNILEMEKPDFVVFGGDQLTAEQMYSNGTDYIDILLKPLIQKNYRWASVYGNHDIGQNVSRLSILKAEQKHMLSYTFQMNSSLPGVTNYYLPIYSDGADPVMLWWFFDSQGGRTDAGEEPAYIDPAVVQWFRHESARLQHNWGVLPSLVFFHIPPLEYVKIQENVRKDPLCSGQIDDIVSPQNLQSDIMKHLASAGGIRTVFVGHNHGNAWCCFYGMIQVCYNKHTGYGGYGQWARGARIVHLDLQDSTKTKNYIRMETGDIIDEFPNLQIANV